MSISHDHITKYLEILLLECINKIVGYHEMIGTIPYCYLLFVYSILYKTLANVHMSWISCEWISNIYIYPNIWLFVLVQLVIIELIFFVWIVKLYSIFKLELIFKTMRSLSLFPIGDLFFSYTNNYSDVYILFRVYTFANYLFIFTSTIHELSPLNTSAYCQFSGYFWIHGTVDFQSF